MTARPPNLPPPRTAADWLTDLSGFDPQLLVAGCLTLLRVEVLVQTEEVRPLDGLTAAVLRAMALADPPTLAVIDRLVLLGEERTGLALDDTCRLGLAERSGPNFIVTDRGRSAVANGLPAAVHRRRWFTFRDGHFLPWPDAGPITVRDAAPGPGPVRGLQLVSELLARDPEWKNAAGVASGRLVQSGEWRAVPLVSELEVTMVAVRTAEQVLAFAVDEAFSSITVPPALRMKSEPARAALPELFAGPGSGELRSAWTAWARSRSIPDDDLAACELACTANRLAVTVPAGLGAWLRTNRADAFTTQTWLWLGAGSIRRPAVLDLRVAE